MPAPVNSGLPAISGSVDSAGNTVTVSNGTWTNSPTSFSYQWQKTFDGTTWETLSGAVTNSYVLTTYDFGFNLRCVVSASNASGSTTAASNPTRMAGLPVSPPPMTIPSVTFTPREYGVMRYGGLFGLDVTTMNSVLSDMVTIGAKWTRCDFSWELIQPNAPLGIGDATDPNNSANNFDWTLADQLVSACEAHGVKLIATLDYSPTWARAAGSPYDPHRPPLDNQTFANFAIACARRYGTRITAYEIWNEPNNSQFWYQNPAEGYPTPVTGLPGADYNNYADMFALAASGMHSAAPGVTVINGGFSPATTGGGAIAPVEFLRGMYNRSVLIKAHLDAVTHHPYSFPYSPLNNAQWNSFRQACDLYKEMCARGDGTKKVWATELAWPTSPTPGDNGVDPRTQAKFLSQAMLKWADFSFTGPMVYFGLYDNPNFSHDPTVGLIQADGTHKPAYGAYQQVATQTYRTGRKMGFSTGADLPNETALAPLSGASSGATQAEQAVEIIYQAGADVLRFECPWAGTDTTSSTTRPVGDLSDPNNVVYSWGKIDALMDYASARSMKALLYVHKTPAWANGNRATNYPPTATADYANFCIAVVRRYQARNPGTLLALEIWQEPNNPVYWRDPTSNSPNANAYTAFLKTTFAAVKAVDNTVFILAGSLSQMGTSTGVAGQLNGTGGINAVDFVSALYASSVKDGNNVNIAFDAIGYKPYSIGGFLSPTQPRTTGHAWLDISNVYFTMQSNGDGDKRIWSTEIGISTDGPSAGHNLDDAATGWVDESDQSSWVTDEFNQWFAFPYHGTQLWFEHRDRMAYPAGYNGTFANAAPNTVWPTTTANNFGLWHSDLTPKPSVSTFISIAGARVAPIRTGTYGNGRYGDPFGYDGISTGTGFAPLSVAGVASFPTATITTTSPGIATLVTPPSFGATSSVQAETPSTSLQNGTYGQGLYGDGTYAGFASLAVVVAPFAALAGFPNTGITATTSNITTGSFAGAVSFSAPTVAINNPATVAPSTFAPDGLTVPSIVFAQQIFPVTFTQPQVAIDTPTILGATVSIFPSTFVGSATVWDNIAASTGTLVPFDVEQIQGFTSFPAPSVVVELPDQITLYSRPTVSGVMRESPDYRVLGVGLTDRVFLLGHADGLPLNDPYQILSIQDGINKLNGDTNSPLLRGMLEAYYAGARDIWIMAVAPMDEYVSDVSDRARPGSGRGATDYSEIFQQYFDTNTLRTNRGVQPFDYFFENDWENYNFHQRYWARLQLAYEVLTVWDMPQIMVPLEANYYDSTGVDFLFQLARHCSDAFDLTGSVRIGLLGTKWDHLTVNQDDAVLAMAHDQRVQNIGDIGKFVSVIVGEGVFNFKEFPTMYSTPLAAASAGLLATLPLDSGLTYKQIPNVLSVVGADLTKSQLNSLTQAKLNPVARTTAGKRGSPFHVAVLTDNTLGTTGTDYWSLLQMRLVLQVIERLRALGYRFLGTIGYGQFKQEIQNYLYSLVTNGQIRSFTFNIVKDTIDLNKALVDVSVQPYFGLRNISFVTTVGPGL